ncbi:hypothetical protein Tco_0868256, partial [Tanacetum coccineum]
KNGEVIIEVEENGKNKSRLEVYEPSSGRINDIGINEMSGKQRVNTVNQCPLNFHQCTPIGAKSAMRVSFPLSPVDLSVKS